MVLPKTFSWPEHRLTITIVPDWDLPVFIFGPTWKIPLPVPPCLWTKKAILKQFTCCATGDYMQFKSLNVFCDRSMSIVFGLLFLILRIAAVDSSWLSLQCSYFINIFVCVSASISTDIGAVWLCLISCSRLLLTWITDALLYVYLSTCWKTLLRNCVYKLSHIRMLRTSTLFID